MPLDPPHGMDFDETKAWIEAAVAAELLGLKQAQDLQINLSAYQAWLLLQLLQQGYHRLEGDAHELARDLGKTIEDGYLAQGTVLRRFADLGWQNDPARLNARETLGTGEARTPTVGIPDAYRRAWEE
jgi:hypothetical protein